MNHQNLLFVTTILLGVLFVCTGCPSVRADILTLNNGDELFGQIRSISTSEIAFEKNGAVSTYTHDQVLKLEFETLKMPEGEDTVERIKDPLIQELLKAVPSAVQYPQATRLDVLDEEVVELKDAGTWTSTFRQVFVPFKEVARDDANHAFGYSPDIERPDVVYGRAITPPERGLKSLLGGRPGSVRYLSDHTIADAADFGSLPMYQRRHTVKFAIPEVMIGTIVDRQYRKERFQADPLKPFLWTKAFRGREPARLTRLVVRAPRSLEVVYQVLGPANAVQVRVTEKDHVNEWCFESRDTEGVIEEPLMPGLQRLMPQVTVGLKNTWANVARDYEAVIAPLRQQALDDATVAAEVDRICSGTADLAKKGRRIFEFLARNIGHAGVLPDRYSWRPHTATEILKAKQANHVDRAFLYHCLLLKAGIENQLLPVRFRAHGEIASEVPSLLQMSGCVVEIASSIASVPISLPVRRDLGPEVTLSWLQGATCLRLTDGSMIPIPFHEAKQEGSRTLHEGEITQEGSLRMTTIVQPNGNVAADWRSMRDYSRKQQEKWIEGMLNDAFPGARLLSFSLEHLDDTAAQPKIEWQWEVASYALHSGDDLMVIPLPVERKSYSAASVGPFQRRWPLSWTVKQRDEQTISLKLPAGFSVYALPEGDFAVARGMYYHSRFGFSVDRVLFTDSLERREVDLETSEYSDYKKLMECRSQTSDQWIVVRRNP